MFALAHHHIDWEVYKLIVHQANDHFRFTAHRRMHRIVTEAFAVNRIYGRSNRGTNQVARIDVL